ncbi:MAG TPA: MBL fold metallo-hydrolase, partial [Acidimicrobiales bacterium]|nr:MBL fold metallo-hydrolase [Acidimicrobiales bacterium]
VGDTCVQVRHVGGPAHTVGDAYVWLPDHGVVFTGDLVFNGGTPFVLMGSVTGALAAVEVLRALGATTLVPGHGPVCGPDALDTVASYLAFVLEVATRARADGVAPLEAARSTDLGEWGGLTDRERIVGNLHRAAADLDAAERGLPVGAPIDVVAAIGDMVAYNDGRPLSCWA